MSPRIRALLVAFHGVALGLVIPTCVVAKTSSAAHAQQGRIKEQVNDSVRVELTGQIDRSVSESVDLGEAERQSPANRIVMVLAGSAAQHAQLRQLLRSQHQHGQKQYHEWLSPTAFAERFGIARSDLALIRSWLESQGFRIDAESAGGRALVFSGNIGQVEDAFHTRIRRYRWHGENHIANATNPTIPKAFAGVVAGFASLGDFRLRSQLVRGDDNPQFTTGSTHYLAPADFATIYDISSPYAQGLSGSGVSIAVLGRSAVESGDLSTFRATFGLAANPPQIIVNGANPGLVSGDELESDLDLEWSGAIAPSATVKFVTSASTSMTDGIDLSALYAVDNDLADVITVSYSGCEQAGDISGGTTFFNQLWEQAAAQGTSVFVSSGDSGAAGCASASASTATGGAAVNALCSSPYSTCVGGTQFSADVDDPSAYWTTNNTQGSLGSALSYIGEIVWNQSGADGGSDLWASGGGASTYFAKPSWQLAPGVPSDGHRDVPDLALNASFAHDGYLVYTSQGYASPTLVAVGGTSAPTPCMAGIAALVVQHAKGRVGNFNPYLYGLAALQANGSGAAVFHQITSGNNSVPGQTGFSASSSDPDYNQATGLGSPDAGQLIASWSNSGAAETGLFPAFAVVPAAASLGSATLTLPANTAWTAAVGASGAGWLSVTPSSGTGSEPLTYSAAQNPLTTARSGTITIDGQVLTVTQAAQTAANGNAPQLDSPTQSINFGTDAVGSASADRQIVLGNTGNANLVLGAITIGGTAADAFSDSGSCTDGTLLVPGAVCYLDVSFDPSAVGSNVANLQIDLGGQDAANVALSGTGVPNSDGGSDGPLPTWAYATLALMLLGIGKSARRRMMSHQAAE